MALQQLRCEDVGRDGAGQPGSPASLVADDIWKSFPNGGGGQSWVLRAIDAEFPRGVSLISGPNGSGKTTLLKLLSGRLTPDRGAVRLFGVDLHRSSRRAIRGAYAKLGAFDHGNLLYAHLTVRENLQLWSGLHPDLRRLTPQSRQELVQAAIERLEIAKFAHKRPAECSLGVVNRLAVARATLHSPKLIIADEPYSHLDRRGRELVTDLLRDAVSGGTDLLVTSHQEGTLDDPLCAVFRMEEGGLLYRER